MSDVIYPCLLSTSYVLLKRPKPTEKSMREHRKSIEKTTIVSQRLITTEKWNTITNRFGRVGWGFVFINKLVASI